MFQLQTTQILSVINMVSQYIPVEDRLELAVSMGEKHIQEYNRHHSEAHPGLGEPTDTTVSGSLKTTLDMASHTAYNVGEHPQWDAIVAKLEMLFLKEQGVKEITSPYELMSAVEKIKSSRAVSARLLRDFNFGESQSHQNPNSKMFYGISRFCGIVRAQSLRARGLCLQEKFTRQAPKWTGDTHSALTSAAIFLRKKAKETRGECKEIAEAMAASFIGDLRTTHWSHLKND